MEPQRPPLSVGSKDAVAPEHAAAAVDRNRAPGAPADGAAPAAATGGAATAEEDPFAGLTPPRTRSEQFRDWLLRLLDSPFFQVLGYIVLFIVVLDGAIFFFFLMGWQRICWPRTNCEPRNQIYNIAVQILNGCFTYMCTVAMPWRCANALHAFGRGVPRRDNANGCDLYGRPSHDVWFHIPRWHRRRITAVLLLNCLTQYANQATRIVFWSYPAQAQFPGNLWTNVFFGLSMLCAALGAAHLVIVEERVRRDNPHLFGPGPIQQLREWWGRRGDCRRQAGPPAGLEPPSPAGAAASMSWLEEVARDPTQNKRGSVLGPSGESVRGGLRMFAL